MNLRTYLVARPCLRTEAVSLWTNPSGWPRAFPGDNQLKPAIHELQLVLAGDPSNQAAEVKLGRIYSRDGRLDRAVEVADGILAQNPEDKDALLVKASPLEWN